MYNIPSYSPLLNSLLSPSYHIFYLKIRSIYCCAEFDCLESIQHFKRIPNIFTKHTLVTHLCCAPEPPVSPVCWGEDHCVKRGYAGLDKAASLGFGVFV